MADPTVINFISLIVGNIRDNTERVIADEYMFWPESRGGKNQRRKGRNSIPANSRTFPFVREGIGAKLRSRLNS